ncbi:uncharacterized protein SCHCODRAFT_01102414 [Schizophyllum commune H4-8]|uniref:uncharacterized protein n=1 Tax=Schizophyllum commune (strain H4-8 / FGSC 9210) TaxID=578458 RepID=UPI00215E1401|nr:uncharacterized protein SCHCODRAFT_01102414 [Schizophyllum commune H4-8]KAI5888640.1 hypothetical protein SCHCODRAFT_01102414 [Schizophyllum commune H4-8]
MPLAAPSTSSRARQTSLASSLPPTPAIRRPQHGNPYSARLSDTSTLEPPRRSRSIQFFQATSPRVEPRQGSSSANRQQPLPRGWRLSTNGYVLRPGEVDFFEEEDRKEQERKERREAQLVRVAEARERRALARDPTERSRLLDERYPMLPFEGTQFWEAGLDAHEQQARLARARERYFNLVVRLRCDPQMYEEHRHHFKPTERLLDPIHDHTELENLRPRLKCPSIASMAPASWVCGNKFVYIDRHRAEFEAATSDRARRLVYRTVARGLLCLAGNNPFEFDFRKQDIENGEEEPTQADVDALVTTRGLTADECGKRATVITGLASDISAYYRRKAKQHNRTVSIDLQAVALAQAAGKTKITVSTRTSQYYSTLCYTERIKKTFEERFQAEMQSWQAKKEAAESAGAPFSEDKPTTMGVRNRVTNEFWAKEPPEYKAMVEKMHAEELDRQRRAARELINPNAPTTPEELQRLYDSAALYLQPFADAAAGSFKGIAAIMICAPMPEDGGDLGVFSVHANPADSLTKAKWPQLFKEKFRQVEKGMLEYGQHVFSKKTRMSRALPSTLTGPLEAENEDHSTPDEQDDNPPSVDDLFDDHFYDHVNDDETSGYDANEVNDEQGQHEPGQHEHEQEQEDSNVEVAREGDNNSFAHVDDSLEREHDMMRMIHEQDNTNDFNNAPRPMTPTLEDEPLFLHASSPAQPSRASSVVSNSASRAIQAPACQQNLPRMDEPHAPSQALPPPPSASLQPVLRTAATPTAIGSHPNVPPIIHDIWKLNAMPAWSEHVRLAVTACRRGQSWATAFGDAVKSYVEFEEAHGFPAKDAGRKVISDKKTRPPQYAAWLKIARPYDRPMLIKDIDEYTQQWWGWLAAHLPEGLRNQNSYLLDLSRVDLADATTWNGLDKACGKDGVLQIVLSLLWWGDAVHGHGTYTTTQRDNWEAACVELSGILNAMAGVTRRSQTGSKRMSSGDAPPPPPAKKRKQQESKAATPSHVSRASTSTSSSSRRRRR